MQKISQTNFFKLFLVVTVFGLFVFLNPAGFFSPVRKTALLIAAPFQKTLYFFSLKSANAKDFIFSIGQLKNENENLLEKNRELTAENALMKNVEKENEFLREQLNFLPREKFDLLPASVITQDSQGFGNWMEIDRGSADGVVDGMAVVVSKGVLIGKVQEVDEHNSKVILITNPKSVINGVVSGTGSKGVARGEYGLSMIYDMVLQSDSLNVGDEVITSGIGSNMPRGLYIGKVQEVHPSDDHLFQQAKITSPVEVSRLQFVFVVKAIK